MDSTTDESVFGEKQEEKKAEEEAGYGWYNPVGWGVAVGVVAGSSSEPVAD